jgi:DNA-nicking Smr family endonuclease
MTDKPRPRTRRRLSDDERALWKTVTRSVHPLRAEAIADAAAEQPSPEEEARKAQKPAPTPAMPKAPARPAKAPPPLAPLDRRMKQRVARGSQAIDLRLDLHGFTQDRAYDALLGFLRTAQANGATLALVITGKGKASDGGPFAAAEKGVLRRQVPQWLRLPAFRSYVVGFEGAHVTHGGEGALYVRIRRARKPTP